VILALDTSTSIASVALYDGTLSGEVTWQAGRNHSVEVMVQARNLMWLRRVQPSELVAIAAATGPGSYTGLRIGLAAAKGLCLALSLPMVGVCTLDILAEPHRESSLPVMAVLDAGRRRYATALYRSQDMVFERVGPIAGMRVEEILASVQAKTLLCGDLGEVRAVVGLDDPLVRMASPASSLRRAGFLAEIAWRRFQGGQVDDPRHVEAYYLGREVA
jgi:tRNA threonylcarbamoyladenosine biosynthesis protein TsaB